eukprot:c6637_g1_i1.p1 GENE.c6637_g1_i1~~c6637_g1_i1.p1  ORF type:complete len:347 (+),score=93.98 c6637_g1_i1:234-1274(+)
MFLLGRGRDSSGDLQKHKHVEEMLKHSNSKEIKLLLLGAGESGKSTIFKQIKIIHNHGFSEDEKKEFIPMIRRHCLENFADLVKGAEVNGCVNQDALTTAKEVITAVEENGLTTESVTKISELWQSEGFQIAFAQRQKFQLSDSAEYFFNNIDRLASQDFVPTPEDIVICRVRTTGVSEMAFEIDKAKFKMVDVGGQRNERRKWIHFFDDVEAVIFVAAISEFDQVMFEDEKTNRLQDSLRLFAEMSNTKFFSGAAMILFLNKNDLFLKKIRTTDLSVCFPEYEGGCDYKASIEFIKAKFAATRAKPDQPLYIHVTCATNTDNISFVFNSVKESVLMRNISQSGFT